MNLTQEQRSDLDQILGFLKRDLDYHEDWRIKRALLDSPSLYYGFGPITNDFDWLINYLISKDLVERGKW